MLRVVAHKSAAAARQYYAEGLKREDYYSEGQEIQGIPRSVIDKFSRRTAQIDRLAAEKGITDPKAKGELGAATREGKRRGMTQNDLKEAWNVRLTPEEKAAIAKMHSSRSQTRSGERITPAKAFDYACEKLFAKNSVVEQKRLVAEALRFGVGQVSPGMIWREFEKRPMIVRNIKGEHLCTTLDILAEEVSLINFVRSGRGQFAPFHGSKIDFENAMLSAEQKAAVKHILTSRDQVIAVRGKAGVGKTTTMKEAAQTIERCGFRIFAFAPSAAASRDTLREAGFANLVAASAQQVLHMQRALDQMNIHLHHVVSDLDGDTGLAIMDAILAGERDPKELVKLRHPRISKSTVAEMEAALKGDWREEHLFVLKQALETYRHLQGQIADSDVEMEKALELVNVNPATVPETERPKNPAANAAAAPKKPKKRTRGNAPSRDLSAQLRQVCGVDLTRIVGFNVLSVLILISEIGVDMSRWRNAKAFSAWLGLCPGNKISGGKVLSSRTAHVVNRVAILLRTLAPTVGRTDTWLGAYHRRMKARLGPPAANTATARKLATLVYHLLKYREEYIDVDRVAYEQKFRRQRLSRLRRQAEELGCEIIQKEASA